MSIVVDWKIKPRTGECHHSGVKFADEEPFYTCIFDDPESDGFLRRDFSVDSWKEISGNLEPSPYSFWKSHFKEPKPTGKQEAVKQNSAEAMLHRMIEEAQPETENARYILALMLERKKILIPTEIKETETSRLLFYEHKDTGSVYIVADPQLKLDEIGSIQEEVSELLEMEEKRSSEPDSTKAESQTAEPEASEPDSTESESVELAEPLDQDGNPDGTEPEENSQKSSETEQ